MTIIGWAVFIILGIIVLAFAIMLAIASASKGKAIAIVLGGIGIVGLMFGGLWWFFHNTASGQRQLVDQKSNISGIERIVNVYTANGDIIATYSGKIDIADADGGYVKFDHEGKRYVYYNCFVETIAEIGE